MKHKKMHHEENASGSVDPCSDQRSSVRYELRTNAEACYTERCGVCRRVPVQIEDISSGGVGVALDPSVSDHMGGCEIGTPIALYITLASGACIASHGRVVRLEKDHGVHHMGVQYDTLPMFQIGKMVQ